MFARAFVQSEKPMILDQHGKPQPSVLFAEAAREAGVGIDLFADAYGDRTNDVLGNGLDSQKRGVESRTETVTRARLFAQLNPICRQDIRLWTDFSIGTGFDISSKEPSAQTVIDEVFYGKQNRYSLSQLAQRRNAGRLNVDGEMFFTLYANQPADVRRLDSLEIKAIVSDSEDADVIHWYLREYNDNEDVLQKLAYRDIYAPKDIAPPPDEYIEQEAVVYFMKLGDFGVRGNSLLLASLDWLNSHHQFMRARTVMTLAMANFAWNMSVKGGQGDVDTAATFFKSTRQGGNSAEYNPAVTPGSTYVHNDAANLEPIKADTGASNAQIDGNQLLQVAGAGVGIFPHYTGAGEAFRLATATAMELPMLKQFVAARAMWEQAYRDILDYYFDLRKVPEPARVVEINAQPIVEKDVPALMNAMKQVFDAWPDAIKSEKVQVAVLTMMGINEPDEVIKEILALPEPEPEPAIQAAAAVPPNKGEEPDNESETEAIAKAAESLADAMNAVARFADDDED